MTQNSKNGLIICDTSKEKTDDLRKSLLIFFNYFREDVSSDEGKMRFSTYLKKLGKHPEKEKIINRLNEIVEYSHCRYLPLISEITGQTRRENKIIYKPNERKVISENHFVKMKAVLEKSGVFSKR